MKFLFTSLYIFLFITLVQAQVNAPYSYYGMGTLMPNTLSTNAGSAYTGTCFDTLNATLINIGNPASYAMLRFTAFDVSLTGNFNSVNNGTLKQKNFDMEPAYFVLGIPLLNKHHDEPAKDKVRWGLATGLVPYSKVSYYLEESVLNNGTNLMSGYFYKGEGGSSRFFIGNGVKIKNLYVGAHINYLFGNMKYRSSVYFPDSINALGTRNVRTYSPSGLFWDAGALYDFRIKGNQHLSLGTTFQAGQSVKVIRSSIWERITRNGSAIDTIGNYGDSTGLISMPMSYSVGLQWNNGTRFRLALNYKYTNWSAFKLYDRVQSLEDNWQLALGTQFVPNPTSSVFLNKCFYRAGVYGGKDYVKINGVQLSNLGVTAGIGMRFNMIVLGRYPVPFYLNAAVDAGSRGTLSNALVKENYVRFQIGVSLNDKWFIPTKYN